MSSTTAAASASGPVLRFAPSPTGALHVGNARTALLAWLEARAKGGRIVLRVDDTDRSRSSEASKDAILRDLAWLGLDFDDEARQSARAALYDAAFEKLRERGLVYPCYERPEELELARKLRLKRGAPPRYDRAALSMSEDDERAYRDQGRTPHWRFRLDDGALEAGAFDFVDGTFGHRRAAGGEQSDPIVRLEDGRSPYHFASVVDDADLGVTLILRGADHLAATHVQIALFLALGAPPPAFRHLPLLHGADGKKLSKRQGGAEVARFRELGLEPEALTAVLAALGRSEAPLPALGMAALIAAHDLDAYGATAPKFGEDLAIRHNHKVIAAMSAAEARPRLQSSGDFDWLDDRAFEALKGEVATLAALRAWRPILADALEGAIEADDRAFLREAAAALPETLDAESVKSWLDDLKKAHGRKGKRLFMPIRRAVSGLDHGPSLGELLPLLGRDKARRRLEGERA